MALTMGKKQNINQKTKDAVSGFIRHEFHADIPNEIAQICLLFYAIIDRFDPKCVSSRITLNEETQTVTQFHYKKASCYLENIVESGRWEWKFQLVRTYTSSVRWAMIGISKAQKFLPMDTYFTIGHNQGYGYSTSDGRKTTVIGGYAAAPYGKKCVDGDIVEMILDFDELSLSFKVNGIDYGKSHYITHGKYRAAVFMSHQG